MAVLIPTFPTLPGLTYPVTRTPIWSSLKQDSWSGKSTPIQLWTYPRRRYTLSFDVLRSKNGFTELQQLEGFYNSVGGSAGLFAFTDPDDGTANNETFGTGDGITTTFQLTRARGGFAEPVIYPQPGLTVAIGDTAAGGYTIGANPGQLVFSTPPQAGAALQWSGTFDWLCRFDNDSYDFLKFMDGFWSAGSITFTTVKL